MELKRVVARVSYRIEPMPGGGFLAYGTDPALPPLEAETKEELLQKMQESISPGGLQLPMEKLESALAEALPLALPNTLGKVNSKQTKILFEVKTLQPQFTATVPQGTKICSRPSKADDNSPIQPEAGSGWNFIRLLAIAAVILSFVYIFLRH